MKKQYVYCYSIVFLLIFTVIVWPAMALAKNTLDDLSTITADGGVTNAIISGIVKHSNNDQQSVTYENDDPLDIKLSIQVAPEDVGFTSKLYIVAKYNNKWFYKDNLDAWHEIKTTADLTNPVYAKKNLQQEEQLVVATNSLLGPGEYLIYVGYLNRQAKVVFNEEPLSFIVFSASNPSLHRFQSKYTLTSYLKKAYQQPVHSYSATDNTNILAAENSGISSTNIQETGVDEADSIKASGQNLFTLGNCSQSNNACLSAYEINESPASNTLLSQIEAGEAYSYSDFYLANIGMDNGNRDMAILVNEMQNFSWLMWPYSGSWYGGEARINMIDVTDPNNMKSLNQIKFEGNLISSRRIGNTLYLVTRTTPEIPGYIDGYPVIPENGVTQQQIDDNQKILDEFKLEDIIPTIAFNDQPAVALHKAEDCYLPAHESNKTPDRTIISVTAIPINEPLNYRSLCIIGITETFYASTQAIYLASSRYHYDTQTSGDFVFTVDEPAMQVNTEIHKIALTDQGMDYRGSGAVSGHLGWQIDKKSFRMGEYNNELRIATSLGNSWGDSSSTNLRILKESENSASLEVIGGIDNLGKPGESLYAARFMGKRGYLVTFRQTDPLYVLDLSDGSKPKVMGELEIDGFSDYLHPIGDKYLLGVGKQVVTEKAENGIDSVWSQGVKISLFDVSAADSIQEIQSLEIGKRGTDTEVLRDHHAFAYLSGDGDRPTRFAMPISLHDSVPKDTTWLDPDSSPSLNDTVPTDAPWFDPDSPSSWWGWTHNGLYVFDLSLTNKPGFELSGKMITTEALSDYYLGAPQTRRAILQGDTVHYFYDNELFSQRIADLD